MELGSYDTLGVAISDKLLWELGGYPTAQFPKQLFENAINQIHFHTKLHIISVTFFFQLQNKRPREKHCNAQAKMGWTGNIISTPFQELIAVCTRFIVDLRVLWVPNSGFNKSWLPELELLNSKGFVAPSGTGMLWVILLVVPRLPFCAATSTNPIPTNTPCTVSGLRAPNQVAGRGWKVNFGKGRE